MGFDAWFFFCVKSICPGFPGGSAVRFFKLTVYQGFCALQKTTVEFCNMSIIFVPLVSYQTCVVLFLKFVETLCYGEVSLPCGMHWMLGGSVKSQTKIHTVRECIHTNIHAYILTYLQTHIIYIYTRGTTPRPILSQNLLICAMFCCLFPCLNVFFLESYQRKGVWLYGRGRI